MSDPSWRLGRKELFGLAFQHNDNRDLGQFAFPIYQYEQMVFLLTFSR